MKGQVHGVEGGPETEPEQEELESRAEQADQASRADPTLQGQRWPSCLKTQMKRMGQMCVKPSHNMAVGIIVSASFSGTGTGSGSGTGAIWGEDHEGTASITSTASYKYSKHSKYGKHSSVASI